jgi:hypothetical protein
MAILDEQKVGEIKWLLLHTRKPQTEIARLYGVSKVTINNIWRGRTWLHVEPIEPLVLPEPRKPVRCESGITRR